ncbi:hypothetical protein Cgig2_030892 [Carnegiea gigantea]|uniref:Uncharacterized protein n=1 Tax=Carnegiea gigantea TaxID=171969 RepID=A0A9Q1GT80_9CARY|nr:hypothetical protein Cgig2_030892 [Carnegiea gigantea]
MVCCLLEFARNGSFSLDSDIPWPASLLGSLPCFASPWARCGSTGPSSKACREKMRRDRLSAVLEPGTMPKCDKTAILSDAIWMITTLHEETSRLKEQNVKLKEKTNELESEKNALRAEKQRMKADKEDIKRRIKPLGAHLPSFQYHPTAMSAS